MIPRPLTVRITSKSWRNLRRIPARIRHGERPDLEEVVREHPEFDAELRDLWGTILLAEDLGGSSRSHPRSDGPDPPSIPRDFADYEILDELGRGGMGVVYKARQKSLGRIVALKLLLRGPHASSSDVARFRAEAEAIAHVDDPHIVPVYEVGEHAGQPYFAMRSTEGETLSRRLQQGPLTSHQAAAFLLPVCRAIAAAHAHNILYRDLKPSNILLDWVDYPSSPTSVFAKRLEPAAEGDADTDLQRAILGTPSYMAPEQASGGRSDIGPACDIYSLGAVLYQMLTGRPPFQAASPLDTLRMVQEQDPLPPRLLNPKVDPDLEMIALKCLQKPAELRYKSAAALADDLDAFLRNEPISARNTRLVEVLSRLFRETHHAGLLENWGLLWMWHGVVLLILCVATNVMHGTGVNRPGPYFWFWTLGLGAWIAIFWALRHQAGPITFVERQIAHVWAGSVLCSTMLFGVEVLLGLPVLTLSPVLALASGSVFLVKAGILSGLFYIPAAALYLTAFVMAAWPQYGLGIFGVVSCLCFFLPGLKYYRQQRQRQA
ncbi:MAG: serine/threonine-protein kinase [Planctomycetales bacterium]